MNILLAHHLEAHHYPIIACFFAVGVYAGWHLLSSLLGRGKETAKQ